MAKRSKRNRQRAKQRARQVTERARQKFVSETLNYEKTHKKMSEYRKYIAEREQDVLSRTLFVTNVRDLKQYENLIKLKEFMEQTYGPIEECKKSHFKGRRKSQSRTVYPPATVRFRHKISAQKIFGGVDLFQVRQAVRIPCSTVGCRGMISVKPSELYDDMVAGLESSILEVQCSNLELGQWFPSTDEMVPKTKEDDEPNEWLTDKNTNTGPTMLFDIKKRRVELMYQDHLVSIRFKELASPVDLCYESRKNRFSLIFKVKYPPKLIKLIEIPGDEPERSRAVQWKSTPIESFGVSLGYKLDIPEGVIFAIVHHKNFARLKQFGVINFTGSEQAIPICLPQNLSVYSEEVADMINEVSSVRIKLLLLSLLGQGKTSPYHLIFEQGTNSNFFGSLTMFSEKLSVQVLEKIMNATGSTKYPNRLFRILLEGLGRQKAEVIIPEHCVSIPRIQLSPARTLVLGFEVEMSNRVVRNFMAEEEFPSHAFLRVQVTDESGLALFENDLTDEIELKLRKTILNGVNLGGRLYKFLAYSSSQLKERSVWMVCPEGGFTIKTMRRSLGDFSMCKTASKYAARIGQCFSTTIQGAPGQDNKSAGMETLRHFKIKDIWADIEKTKCHSDGTGLIRREAMNKLLERIPFAPKDPAEVSMIQVRFGGAKGTLGAWNFDRLKVLPYGAKQSDVCLRGSMIKFEGKFADLEVCSIGKRVPYFLNRNVIFLLSYHGVPDLTFKRLQQEMLEGLDKMLRNRIVALKMIKQLSGPDSLQRSVILNMLMSGSEPSRDPFLFDCLSAIRSHHLFNLRKKARIHIAKGAVLVGGLDETAILPEGTVYFEVNNGEGYSPYVGPVLVTKHPVMHVGDVRMLLAVDVPELHGHRNCILFSQKGSRPEADKMSGSDLDGDEFAVTWDSQLFLKPWNKCEQGKEYCRSIVSPFSRLYLQKGSMERDANILYRANEEAMNFDDPSSTLLDATDDTSNLTSLMDKIFGSTSRTGSFPPSRDSQLSNDLIDHFVNHMKLASVGKICSLWLDFAALKGAGCDECLKLAQLHSIAVDYPKSGLPAKIPKELYQKLGKDRAHWREIKNRQSFECKSIVGQLYDAVIRRTNDRKYLKESELAVAGRRYDKYGTILCDIYDRSIGRNLAKIFDPRIAGILQGRIDSNTLNEQEVYNFARMQRLDFEDDFLEIMNKYKIRSEGEVLTGCIRKYNKLQKKRQHDFAEEVRARSRELRKKYRTNFFRKVLFLVSEYNCGKGISTEYEVATEEASTTSGDFNHEADEGFSDNEDDESFQDNDGEDDISFSSSEYDGEDDSDELVWVEKVSTSGRQFDFDYESSPFPSYKIVEIQRWAFILAAAYYEVTYSSEFRWRDKDQRMILFSFPWIITSDVIANALAENNSEL